jgi:hypothetical protein
MSYTQENNVHEGSRSPWGKIDFIDHIATGIDAVSTPGHGGLKLSAERNRVVHPAWRAAGGWYEEDCEYGIVTFTFPDDFPAGHAEGVAMRWFPDEYEIVTGRYVLPGQSYVRDEQIFHQNHANDLIGVSAIGVEDDMVKVAVQRGGRRGPSTDQRVFLVPKDDYHARSNHGFILDPTLYEELADW